MSYLFLLPLLGMVFFTSFSCIFFRIFPLSKTGHFNVYFSCLYLLNLWNMGLIFRKLFPSHLPLSLQCRVSFRKGHYVTWTDMRQIWLILCFSRNLFYTFIRRRLFSMTAYISSVPWSRKLMLASFWARNIFNRTVSIIVSGMGSVICLPEKYLYQKGRYQSSSIHFLPCAQWLLSYRLFQTSSWTVTTFSGFCLRHVSLSLE